MASTPLPAVPDEPHDAIPWGTGVAGLAGASLVAWLIAAIIASIGGAGYDWIAPLCWTLAATSLVAAAFGFVFGRNRAGSVGSVVEALRTWIRSRSGMTVFWLGVLTSVPVLALHMKTLAADSDSARLVAAILYVKRYGAEYLIETQEVLLPHIVLRAALAWGGIAGMKLVGILSVQLLAGVTSYVTWRLTRSILGAFAAVLALLTFPGIVERALFLPMYGTMLAAGALGLFLMWDASLKNTWRPMLLRCLAAATCFILSLESHQVGQVWLLLSAFLVVVIPFREFLKVAGSTYLLCALLMIPRMLINLAEGGPSGLLSNRIDYWITQDYLTPIQVEFWHLPVDLPLVDYLARIPGGIINIVGYAGLVVVLLVVVAALLSRGRARAFGLICVSLFVGMAVYRKLPFYSRYFSQLLVGAAVAAGAAVTLVRGRGSRYRFHAGASVVLLCVLATVTLGATAHRASRLEKGVFEGPYGILERHVPAGASVAGTRATYLNFLRDDVLPYGEMFFTEQEYATFLTWPDDARVVEVLRERDIDYVMVPFRADRWVVSYNNIWLEPNYGSEAIYHRRVKRSPDFCLLEEYKRAALYRLRGKAGEPGEDC